MMWSTTCLLHSTWIGTRKERFRSAAPVTEPELSTGADQCGHGDGEWCSFMFLPSRKPESYAIARERGLPETQLRDPKNIPRTARRRAEASEPLKATAEERRADGRPGRSPAPQSASPDQST
jgi:hypothetical protein